MQFFALPQRNAAQMKYPGQYFVPCPEQCKQNAIFQAQAIKTGHISIIYRQTCDILSVSSKGTAAAKWQMKISRLLCRYCRYWLQNFTVPLFQLYAKDDFNASLQWCKSFSHCKIIAAKISYYILQESEKLKIDQFYLTQIKLPWSFYLSWVVLIVGPNLEIPFGAQPCSASLAPGLFCMESNGDGTD